MDLNKERYIILEIIPTKVSGGDVAQLSALKINGIKLEDRFDYRLSEEKINIPDIIDMINYDKDNFKYVKRTSTIIRNFKKWIEDYDLLIIDNLYTENYLEGIKNKKESVFKYLNMEFSDNIMEKIMDKYSLVPSNHIVDLLYEAIIYENSKGE